MPSKGSTSARGYGAKHQALRKRFLPLVRSGKAICWRCTERIDPDGPWDLGHSQDRTQYMGPEHIKCNRSTRRKEEPPLDGVDTTRNW